MRLRFKHQKFQADAAKAVVNVFAGQPYLTPSYMMDRGNGFYQQTLTDEEDFTGWSTTKSCRSFPTVSFWKTCKRFNGQISSSRLRSWRDILT